MWVIENVDKCGEGMFVCDAPDKETALFIHSQKNSQATVTSCEQSEWVDVALVTGALGESYYYERRRKVKRKRNFATCEECRKSLRRCKCTTFSKPKIENVGAA